jgi:type II secretory pathway pseudopilin PulG
MSPKFHKNKHSAFSLVEAIVVLGIAFVVAGLVLPGYRLNGNPHGVRKCVQNLKNIGLAFRIYANDHDEKFPMMSSSGEVGGLERIGADDPAFYFRALSNVLSTPRILICPEDKKRTQSTNFGALNRQNVSYFLGLDSTPALPKSLLAGDRNITNRSGKLMSGLVSYPASDVQAVGWTREIHRSSGNIALGDGSVQRVTNSQLEGQMRRSGLTTNRLCFP